MSLAELGDEQREIRDLARRFADQEIAPHAAAWDREHRFPREVLTALGELGLMGVCVPEAHGGAGADFLSYCLVLEELSRADAGLGVTVAVHIGAGTLPILRFGSREQVERLVPALAQGHELAAFALTESGAGSDAARSAPRPTRTAGSRGPSNGSRTGRTRTSSSSSRGTGRRAAARRRSSCAAGRRGCASRARRRSSA